MFEDDDRVEAAPGTGARAAGDDEVERSGVAPESWNSGGPTHPARVVSPPPVPDPALRQVVQPELRIANSELRSESLTLPGMDVEVVSDAEARSREARLVFEAVGGGEAAEPWMDDYWALIGERWSWRQAVYMLWAAQPAGRRAPKTQVELAVQVLGLTSDRVIRTWKRDNPAMAARVARLTVSVLAKATASVLNALVEVAATPDYKAHADRELYLKMRGLYVPRQQVRVGEIVPDDMEELSESELRALAYEAGSGGDG